MCVCVCVCVCVRERETERDRLCVFVQLYYETKFVYEYALFTTGFCCKKHCQPQFCLRVQQETDIFVTVTTFSV